MNYSCYITLEWVHGKRENIAQGVGQGCSGGCSNTTIRSRMKTEKTYKIELEHSEAKTFVSALKKVIADTERIGLKHLGMSEEERELIRNLKKELE